MTLEFMTWVAGCSVAGVLYLLWKNYIMGIAVQTMWETFQSEAKVLKTELHDGILITDTVTNSLIESVERFDERLGIVEKQLEKPE